MHRRRFLAMSAASLWGVRAIAQAAAPRDVPWLEDVRTSPSSPTQPPLAPIALQDRKPVATREAWEHSRTMLFREWLDFLGPLSSTRLADLQSSGKPNPPPLTLLSEDRVDGVVRRLVRYEVEQHQTVEAYLLLPEQLAEPAPGVIAFHSTVAESLRQPAGVEGAPEKAFGLALAKRGCVAICPRNYLWPENHRIDAKGEAARFLARNPQSKGMDRMLLDGLVAADILASQPEVDPNRLGCIGHSLGAKEVLYLAAFDRRMRAAVSSEGGVGVSFSNWHDPWYLGPTVREPEWKHDHHELLALAAPCPFLLLGGDSADGARSWPYIEAALPIYRRYGDSPRLGLLNHRQGHSVPPQAFDRMLEWMLTYL